MSNTSTFGRRGYTLIEMIAVMGIILIIAGIALPVIKKANDSAMRNRQRMDFSAISLAIDAYAHDFNGTIPMDVGSHDMAVLTKAMFGWDGTMSGFSMVAGDRTYGPYLPPDRFSLGPATGTSRVGRMLDRFGREYIQYFPRYSSRCVPGINASAGATSLFEGKNFQSSYLYCSDDGDLSSSASIVNSNSEINGIRYALGDNNLDNFITSPPGIERLRYSGPYILASAGQDLMWLVLYAGATVKPFDRQADFNASDDIYNFDR